MKKLKKLKEVSILITKGTTPTTVGGRFVKQGINFVKSESIGQSKFLDKSNFEHIESKTDEKLKRSRLQEKDLLFSIAGAYLAKIGIVQKNDLPANTNQAVGIVRLDIQNVDVNYLYYYFSQSAINKYINALSSQSSQPNLNLELLGNLEYEDKDLPTQKKIAQVLSSLDAKIALNQKINRELEAMAKTLYDYWFVQFDFPNEHGKPYRSSGGKMVFSEALKREVPEGWEITSLWNIANFTNGLACQKFRPIGEKFLRVIKIREMREGFTQDSEFVKFDIPQKVIVNDGDVLFSWSASLEVMIWANGVGVLNQHIFKVTSSKFPKSFYYFQLVNYLQHFKMLAENRKTTMGHITLEHLKQSQIVIPPKELTIQLEKKIAPIFEKILNLKSETRHLINLRDFLLPLLMNGQVWVSEER